MFDNNSPPLEKIWQKELSEEFKKDYFHKLKNFLEEQYNQGKTVYPPKREIFEAFNSTPFNNVKVVIVGQDPYHGSGQAHGMCFSVRPGVKVPPSLVNIYKELKEDVDFDIPKHGYLKSWAQKGVFLLNTVLTVEEGKAGSHRNKGWEQFTDVVLKTLNSKKKNLVFLLWGSPAAKKEKLLDGKRHLILKAPHPSPLSAYRGFFGCRHFSQTNCYLKKKGKYPIDWQLPQKTSS